jgi:histone H3/H4
MAKRYFPYAPTRRLMKEAGAKIVSADAMEFLIEYLENKTREITDQALTYAKHASRKKVMKSDIRLALGK